MAYYYKKHWTPDTCKRYADHIFIFGDNDESCGKGGQAVIRDEPNAMGIPTKKRPNNHPSSFYTDDEYYTNIQHINRAIAKIKKRLINYNGLMYPIDGIGTGLAQLNIKAPKTFIYLNKRLRNLFRYAKSIKRVLYNADE